MPIASITQPSTNALTDLKDSKQIPDFSGTWIKDKEKSESMGEAIKLMALGGLVRQAVKLIRGVKITQDSSQFTMAVFSVISWFKVTERYKLNGEESSCKRRDLRRGGHKGQVEALGDKLLLHLKWDEPYGGTGWDEFTLKTPDELHIKSSVTVRDQTVQYTTVYNRKH